MRRSQLVRPPLQDPIQGDAVERADQDEFPGGNREKVQKREEKELLKAAEAAGVKLVTTQNSAVAITTPGVEPAPAKLEKRSGFTIGGWPMVSSPPPGGGFKKLGWTHCLEPTETHFTAPSPSEPPRVMTVPPSPMTPTSGFQERRLDGAQRLSACAHPKQTADA